MTILVDVLTVISIPFTLVYIVIPIMFAVAPSIMQRAFFLNFVTNPFANYENLAANGIISRGRNFFLKDGKRVDSAEVEELKKNSTVLGAWHILPLALSKTMTDPSKDEIEATLRTGEEPVFVYLHGNSFDRATRHRCDLYNVLAAMDFHVVTIDYRGFGNSSGCPTEDGLIADSHCVYDYVRSLTPPNKPVYVWGHSMGSGVAIRLVAELSDHENNNNAVSATGVKKLCPNGMILESPFNNLRDVVRNHPFSVPLRSLPFFDEMIILPLMKCGLVMSSDVLIGRVNCPILVLHAVDDHIIPVSLARKLVSAAQKAQRRVVYVEFAAEREFKHRYICHAPELPDIMRSFFDECKKAVS